MKNVKKLLSLLLVFATVISMAVVITGCKKVPTMEGCTVEVKSEGGKALENVGVYIYKNAEKTELVEFVKTDAQGIAAVTAPVPEGSVVVLDGVPAGYVAEENYPITATKTKIVLPIQLQEQMGTLALGDVMFDFTVTDISGTEHTLSELLKTKKAVVINLWFTNCQPCKNEFPYLVQAYNMYAEDIQVLAINPEGDSEEDIAAFAQEYGLNFPTAKGDEAWKSTIANLAYPTTIIIDRFGTVGLIHIGGVDRSKVFKDAFAYFVSDDYVQSTVENITDVATPAAIGEQDNPQEFAGVTEFEVTVPAGEDYYCNVYRVSGMELLVESESLKLTYGETVCESEEGVVKLQLPVTTDPRSPFALCFTNTGAEEETYKVTLTYPEGAMENPFALKLGKVNVEVPEGNAQGVYYSFTAEEKRDLALTGLKKDKGYDVVLYNLTTSVQKTLAVDAAEEDGKLLLRLPVDVGDEVQILVTSIADSEGNYPAVSVSFTASMEDPAPNYEGTLVNPDAPVEQYGFKSFSIDVAAGEKKLVYIIRAVNESTLSIKSKHAYVVYNGKTYKPNSSGVIYIYMASDGSFTPMELEIGNSGIEEQTFKVNFYFAEGTRENPIKLKDGENTIKCAKNNDQGIFYSYKASTAGKLTLEVTNIDPSNVVCKISISDMQRIPTVVELQEGSNTVSIDLPAGAKAEIVFSTKDPKKEWKIPAAEVTLTATFE